MGRARLVTLGSLLTFAVFALGFAPAPAAAATFQVGVFADASCKTFTGPVDIDTSKACVNYSYVDSKGVTTNGSLGNFRCYADKVVLDKYPFAKDCDPKAEIVNKDWMVPAPPGCNEAPSHEGPVYESLVGYTYPGTESCKAP
jgi:hypothetical protein